jgi:hypothetical protein
MTKFLKEVLNAEMISKVLEERSYIESDEVDGRKISSLVIKVVKE